MTFNPFSSSNIQPWLPSDNNLLITNGDPKEFNNNFTLIAGTIYLVKWQIRNAIPTLSNIILFTASGGSGASTGSFCGIYNSAGTRIAISADCATQFQSGFVPITIPLLTPIALSGGFVWVAFVSNLAVTQPQIGTSLGNGNVTNLGLTAANYAFCVNGTGATALPATITPASNSLTGNQSFWAGGN